MDKPFIQNKLFGFPLALVKQDLISETIAQNFIDAARQQKKTFITYLYESNSIPSHHLMHAIAAFFDLPLFDLNTLTKTSVTFQTMAEEIIHNYRMIPIKLNDQTYNLIIADPTESETLEKIKFMLGSTLTVYIEEPRKIEQFIEQIAQKLDHNTVSHVEKSQEKNALTDETFQTFSMNEAPIIRLIHKYIKIAVKKGASDIHFEPYEQKYRIRARIDGLLSEIFQDNHPIAQQVTTTLKVLAQLDIAEKRLPQDGHFKIKIDNYQTFDFRVSTCPTLYGEKIVLRLQETTKSIKPIHMLGLDADQQAILLKAIQQPQGLILATGPTGSGKSISLYSILNHLNSTETNIISIEDPVEIQIDGINQVNINHKAGFTFANALRSFLRQDPDIIMVGEMRDQETAELAIRAAQTGHLVLSTLHTNSAAETITRLKNFGIAPYNIASSLNLIMAQRLIRTLCPHCKVNSTTNKHYYNAVGCEHCQHGYKGRTALFETLAIPPKLKEAIAANASAQNILEIAKSAGMKLLFDVAQEKILLGQTTLAEVLTTIEDAAMNET